MANENELLNIPLGNLRLDDENPRLPTTIKRDHRSMLEYIARTSSITELMTAIGQHGYFPGEPLIVVPSGMKGAKKPKFTVVEGNRRLTALLLLQKPDLMPKSSAVQVAASEATYKPDAIPCIVFKNRSDVINYLGYRHITGIKQWEPLAKARYIAQYYESETSEKAKASERYRAVARSIGSRPTFIKRQLDGLAIFRMVEEARFFDIDGLDEENISFSLITTALGYDSVLSFVSTSEHPYENPKEIKKAETKELVSWLFKKDAHGETLLGDSRNIRKLALIVENTDALQELRDGASLDVAYNKTKGVSDEFTELLVAVERDLSRIVSMVALLEVDSRQIDRIRKIDKLARFLTKNATDDGKN